MEKNSKKIIIIVFIFILMLLIICYLGYRLSVEKKINLDTQPINFSTENTEKDNTIKELNDKIDELTNSNNNIDEKLESAIAERDELINEIKTCTDPKKIKELETKINDKNTVISELQDSKEELLAQIESLKNELDKIKNTFVVFYVADGTTIYKEKVYKGENVKNVPSVPTYEDYLGEWASDGKNIQNDVIIYAKYYYGVTIDILKSDGNPVAYSNVENDILKIYREDSKEITFYNNTIKRDSDTLVVMNFYTDYNFYNHTTWELLEDGTDLYSDHTFEVTGNMTVYYRPYYGCIAAGSKIAMADGTEKLVENVKIGDNVLSYDKFTGTITSHKIINIYGEEDYSRVFTVKLANGNKLDIIDLEFLFDIDKKEYIPININTYKSMIGKNVMVNNNGSISSSKIISITMEEKVIEHYTLYTDTVFNYIANGIVGVTPIYYLNMLYTIKDNYKIDYDKYNSDIAKYGLYTYDEFKDICSKEVFDTFRIKDFKPAVEKGLLTINQLKNGIKELQADVDSTK